MTATAVKGASTRVRPWLPLIVLVGVVLVVGLLLGPSTRGGGRPLDPRSSRSLGTKGLVEVLRGLGATVDVTSGAPDDSYDTALVLNDDLGDRRRQELAGWVTRGGTLLLADPVSPLNPFDVVGSTDLGFLRATIDRHCSLPALREAGRVAAPGAAVMKAPRRATGCFPRNDGYWLVTAPAGRGNLVVVGGAGSFVNRTLDDADNEIVMASLLAPRSGARVAFLRPPPPGRGAAKLADLVAPRVKSALWQLAVAFAVLALWRARRLGRPVLEPQPVQLEGSELVLAVGNLLQRARSRAQAGELLRADLRRALCERLGLGPSTGVEDLADVAAARTGVPRDRLHQALAGPPPADDTELVALAQLVESVRQEVTRA